jgi:NAD(P)-dependent dehydrogenase (short-subunit alcohol dehydrogenase family)
MSHPLNNQVVLITGAGGGIGRELALQLSRLGAVIAGVDLTPEPLERLVTDLKAQNGAGGWELGDVTKRDTLHAAVAALSKRLGPIEMLIANAGIGIENPALGFQAEAFERQVNVNLTGVANSVEAVLPAMIERRRGHLVALASLASYRGLPLMAGYCASKAGVVALMDSLRLELRPLGIHCTTICPGWILTPLTRDLPDPKPAMMTVEDAVARMVRAILAKKPFVAFPAQSRWPLAFNRLLPSRLGDWMTLNVLKRMRTPRK